MLDRLQYIIYSIPGILLAFTFHSYAKGRMADKLGDKTPRFQGRLTLNPLSHIEPIGALLIAICGIGWAKPIETNPSAYKNFYKDDLKVSLAGPFALLGVAIVTSIIYPIVTVIAYKVGARGTFIVVILSILSYIIRINVSLFIFYLLPLPGMDGFNIFRDLSPKNFYKYGEPLIRYQFFILIGIILLAGPILSIPAGWVLNGLQHLINLIMGILL